MPAGKKRSRCEWWDTNMTSSPTTPTAPTIANPRNFFHRPIGTSSGGILLVITVPSLLLAAWIQCHAYISCPALNGLYPRRMQSPPSRQEEQGSKNRTHLD